MKDFGQKMDYSARLMLPGIATLILFTLILLPVGMAGMADFPPHITLISIYYWTIFYPAAMPYWFVFLLGIVVDSMHGDPLGVSSLVYLVFRFLVLVQQRLLSRETFVALWFSFGFALAIILLIYWLVLTIYHGVALPLLPAVMQWAFTFGVYPLAHMGFSVLYRYLPTLPGSRGAYPGRRKK